MATQNHILPLIYGKYITNWQLSYSIEKDNAEKNL